MTTRTKRTIPLSPEEARARHLNKLRDVQTRWNAWKRRLESRHGARWHSALYATKLEYYERKGLALTKQLERHPEWWTLPCECAECRGDGE